MEVTVVQNVGFRFTSFPTCFALCTARLWLCWLAGSSAPKEFFKAMEALNDSHCVINLWRFDSALLEASHNYHHQYMLLYIKCEQSESPEKN